MPQHVLSGSFSIHELVAEWKEQSYSQPQLWLDLGSYREQHARELNNWYFSQGNQWLLQHPALQPLPFSHLPAFPQVSVSVSVPKLPTQEILTASTRLAYGISLASFLFFLGPIVILEGQQAWKKIQAELGNGRVYSANTYETSPSTPKPSPEPYATTPEDVFSLRVPALDIESVVVPNVDSTDKNSYTTALEQGIAHAAGTGFPDQLEENKTVYLFAHSTDATWNVARYNAQFYALKDAEIGQEIHVRFWNEDYTYRITEKKVIAADDTSYMASDNNEERLVLQTCYPPGTTWKRLVIVAVPEEKYQEAEPEETSHNTSSDDIDKNPAAQYNTQTV